MDIDARIERLVQQQEASDRRQKALDESIGELVAIGRRTDERLDRTDERLERITERHEALALTVELLGQDMRGYMQEQREWTAKAGTLIVNLADTMTRLGKIAENHEHRITRVEGGPA